VSTNKRYENAQKWTGAAVMRGKSGRASTAVDRRVARTRTLLQQALMTLILRKNYDAITIKEICDAANVGRSTFYSHFTSKDELKRSGLEHLRATLAAKHRDARAQSEATEERMLSFSRIMFEHAREHADHYRALVGSHGGSIALGTIREILLDVVRDDLARSSRGTPADDVPREFVVQFVVGAYMAVLTWWLDEGAKLSPQRVDAMFRRLARDGVVQPDA
jgi:AcrR family transcriptional regulator